MAIPYYRWFPGDYARGTRHLSLMQHGVYRLLIDLYMDQGGPLRNDLPYLYRWLHAESVEEKNSVEFILAEFFLLTPEGWRHKRCDSEIAWRENKSGEAQESAKKRWQSNRNANAMPTYSERNANQNQNQNQIPEPNLKPKPEKSKTARAKGALAVAAFAAPSGVDPALWQDYCEHRKAKRAKLTQRAYELLSADLARMQDPNAGIRQSIKNGWTGVFPARGGKQDARSGVEQWLAEQPDEKDITDESERTD